MKSKKTAYLLWFFLGIFGAHKFYLDKLGMGVLYILTGGLFFVGWIIDLFTLGKQVDQHNQNPPKPIQWVKSVKKIPEKDDVNSNNKETNNNRKEREGSINETLKESKSQDGIFGQKARGMNYKHFSIRGINPETGRKKTIKLDVPNNTTPYKMALEQGTINEPFEITGIPFREPTYSQLAYAKDLEVAIPPDACLEDVSALISRAVDSDGVPNQGLIEYASNKGLMFSEYIGKKALYNLIFYKLKLNDKIAFFCFSVYRYLSDDRHANLDTSPYRDIFYSFAQQYEGDKNFVSSMEKYEGEDLRYFGRMKIKKEDEIAEITGGSIATTAYKTVSNFLQTKFNTPFTRTKTIQGEA
jgi:hypothetical protein